MKHLWNNKVRLLMVSLCFTVICGSLSPLQAARLEYPVRDILKTFVYMADPFICPFLPPDDFGCIPADELGLSDTVQPWEDTLRSGLSMPSFEWWYFDGHLYDGDGNTYAVVVVFYSKPMFSPDMITFPIVQVTFKAPDATFVGTYKVLSEGGTYSFETQNIDNGCGLQIGESTITRNSAGDYVIHAAVNTDQTGTPLVVDLTMKNSVASWRPGSGHWYYHDFNTYFAYLVQIPSGTAEGTITYTPQDGVEKTVTITEGSSYHDHNWGNQRMYDHMKYWWWSRVQTLDGTGLTAVIVNMREKHRYGNNTWQPVFGLMNEHGVLIDAEDPDVTMTMRTNCATGNSEEPILLEGDSATFRLDNTKTGDWAEITVTAQTMLLFKDLYGQIVDGGMSPLEIYVLQLFGDYLKFDPSYVRYAASASVSYSIGGTEYNTGADSNGYIFTNAAGTFELMDLE